jgi:hypothetical protein
LENSSLVGVGESDNFAIPASFPVIPAEAGIYKNDTNSFFNNEANANNNLIDSGLNPE